jgi:hypothetical protein
MSDAIVVHWEVDDGYVGGKRPQTTKIPREEYDEAEDKKSLIQDYVEYDFNNRISFFITRVVE